ncbi:MAG TPA: glycosyl hydrolase family 8 [Ramlibacter sp.]|jgi:endo-1,4-beta-D-glucanase Y|uniref:glycosyl hydrolase family 8 n=1 Tax=Ramlibacter sp. TaxID=1917967 RepID=UPI002D6BBAD3|nr:glycosyl hydrolase family 8 [Ramlibacter sp.]HZY19168.1 glycosyl hydrolase family 8 [Ramlibacter sp.]
MKRRLFLLSGSASAVSLALTACGGGGGGGSTSAGGDLASGVSTTGARRAVSGPVSYPFGSRLDAYVAGIKPSASTSQMDDAIRGCYDAWKARAIAEVPSVPGGLAVRFGNSPDWLTVSEGIGYGMLIAVLMAGHDAGARDLFDGLLTLARARPAYGTGQPALMDWRLERDGSSSERAGGGWNAMDGDLDIAMALLMADRQWGSTSGKWNYKQEALATINAMKAWNFREDGATKGLPSPFNNRTSDYMIGHFRAFGRATGDAFWDLAVNRAYELLDYITATYSPNCGLTPDFIVNTNTPNPAPSPGFIGDGVATEGDYYANAQRNPWRFGTDYVTSGDERFKRITQKMVAFIQRDCGGNPASIATGYHLDGTAMGRSYAPKGMIGPMLVGAMVDGSFQGYLDTLWNWTASNFTTDYYDSELMLIPMLVASGNWWNP